MDGEGEGEIYEVWDCGACVAVCSGAFYAVLVDHCDGGGALGGGSGEGEEGYGGSDGSASVC